MVSVGERGVVSVGQANQGHQQCVALRPGLSDPPRNRDGPCVVPRELDRKGGGCKGRRRLSQDAHAVSLIRNDAWLVLKIIGRVCPKRSNPDRFAFMKKEATEP